MIPELETLDSPGSLLRIPPETDVPVTARVLRIIDSQPMRRLARVSQLGLVSLVYPGAVHSRLEHSLGVYRTGLLVLKHLLVDPRVASMLGPTDAEAFVLATLLHDCGHWPFCHPIEDMGLAEVPRHESRAARIIHAPELADLIASDWKCDGQAVLDILEAPKGIASQANDTIHAPTSLLASILNGPIDVDKMDYLVRDSLHAGVPYGRNFDVGRLIGSFQLHPHQSCIAIGEKGRTAAEMMVFARYVMFSEVYWHHTVRSATAMLQRAVYLLRERIDLAAMFDLDDAQWIASLRRAASGTQAEPLVESLFGRSRRLLKRIAQFSVLDQPEQHRALAHRPYPWLAEASAILAAYLSRKTGMSLGAADVIIDAPPVKLEVDIRIDVLASNGTVVSKDGGQKKGFGEGQIPVPCQIRPLGEVSPVVNVLARKQFDGHVKRVRVFVREDIRQKIGVLGAEELHLALDSAGFDLSPMAVGE